MRTLARSTPLVSSIALILAAGAAVALVGCKAVGPDYVEPQLSAPDQWVTTTGQYVATTPADLSKWWSNLNDPILSSLMDRAVAGNLDLKIATARIREARAARSFSAAAEGPTVNTSADYSRFRNSENTSNGRASDSTDGHNLFAAGLDASWELDVFGGVRRSVEAADADIGAAVWNRRNVTVSLLGEVALNYMDLRTAQQRIIATRANVDTQTKTVELSTSRFTTGLDSEIDATRARSQRAATQSLIPALEAQAHRAIYRLAVLTGQNPGALVSELEPIGVIPTLTGPDGSPGVVPMGVPTELIRRRADIRQAERQLAAANARIGVATADLYPRFRLGGSVGLSTQFVKNWAEGDSLFWSVGPGVNWNLFDGGAIRANIGVNEARTEQFRIGYQSTLLNALREVDAASITYVKTKERAALLSEAVTQQQRAVELANQLFAKQLTNFLTVLDSQRRLFELQDELVGSQGEVGASLVALYKALGGGWEEIDAVLDGVPNQSNGAKPAGAAAATQAPAPATTPAP